MNSFHVRTLAGSASRSGAAITAALAIGALATPAQAWKVSIHVTGGKFGLWITVGNEATSANYDSVTHAGLIPYNLDGPFQTMDVMLTDVPGLDGLPVTLTGDDFANIMGEFEVVGGLGTTTTDLRLPNIWITGGSWGIHIILNPGTLLEAAMTLDGFDGEGNGLHSAHGLALPIELHVERPDGSIVVVTDTITDIEFSSPLDLSDPCAADCDGNGTLNIDDIDCFISAFLGQCS